MSKLKCLCGNRLIKQVWEGNKIVKICTICDVTVGDQVKKQDQVFFKHVHIRDKISKESM